MKKSYFLTVALVSLAVFTSCKKNNEVIEKSLFVKGWTQSYEEKTSEDIEIYRPSDYKIFAPSRYRQIFNFYDNGVCDYLVLAANDAHYMERGSWDYYGKTNSIKIFASNSEMLYEFEVVELTDNLLKLKARN